MIGGSSLDYIFVHVVRNINISVNMKWFIAIILLHVVCACSELLHVLLTLLLYSRVLFIFLL